MSIKITLDVDPMSMNLADRRDAAILQTLLAARGYIGWGEIDGFFGGVTNAAVRAFQNKAGLKADGIVGPLTWEAITKEIQEEVPQPSASTTEAWLQQSASTLGVDLADLLALCDVESAGSSFFADGRPKILFEGHIFWKELDKRGIEPRDYVAGNEDILYEKWTRDHYKGGVKEYDRLGKAMGIHVDAALCSASWGRFQIMGFNYKASGFESVKAFVDAHFESEVSHYKAFISFIINNPGMHEALKSKNYDEFFRRYNGAGYKQNGYDIKFYAALKKYQAEGRC